LRARHQAEAERETKCDECARDCFENGSHWQLQIVVGSRQAVNEKLNSLGALPTAGIQ